MPINIDLNVFINCPFDKEYSLFFDAILFAVYACGFRPRCAMEVDDSSDIRIEKIIKIIKDCRFGIHDISRTELDSVNNLPRFNMPLELGLFLGAKRYGSKQQKSKVLLIFDKEQFRYQKYISDIAGQDIKSHNSNPYELIKAIRNTLNAANIDGHILGATRIIDNYREFISNLPDIQKNLSLSPGDVTYADKTQMIEQWLKIV